MSVDLKRRLSRVLWKRFDFFEFGNYVTRQKTISLKALIRVRT